MNLINKKEKESTTRQQIQTENQLYLISIPIRCDDTKRSKTTQQSTKQATQSKQHIWALTSRSKCHSFDVSGDLVMIGFHHQYVIYYIL